MSYVSERESADIMYTDRCSVEDGGRVQARSLLVADARLKPEHSTLRHVATAARATRELPTLDLTAGLLQASPELGSQWAMYNGRSHRLSDDHQSLLHHYRRIHSRYLYDTP